MDDRTLLELAARAAGIKGRYVQTACGDGIAYEGVTGVWRPHLDDGDALRLAVKLGLIVDVSCYWIAKKTAVTNGTVNEVEPHGKDPYAATRRAIVRAAAAIAQQSEDVE